MTTQGDKMTLIIEPEYGGLSAVADILGVSRSTAQRMLNEWRAAGRIGIVRRKFHLRTVRILAAETGLESYGR